MTQRRSPRVFGPVPSRRLGRSLGVDMLPFKTCSLDCVYCQLGPTTCKTVERREWVDTAEVLSDLKAKLDSAPDYVTLSGSGEPTLHSRFGEMISLVRETTDTPVAVLTNATLLYDPAVRRDLALADLVVPSLDAPDAQRYSQVNRPHESLRFDRLVEDLVLFRPRFKGRMDLELFFLAGVNDDDAAVEALAGHVRRIRPDRMQLNTVSRPPAESDALPVPRERLLQIARFLGDTAEVIADYGRVHERAEFQSKAADVLSMLERRPCTLSDLAAGLAIHENEAAKYVEELLQKKAIRAKQLGEKTFFEPEGG